jgi:hypothetical protein
MLRDICLSFSKKDDSKYNSDLDWDSLFIGALFLQHLGKIKTGRCQKIIITGVDVIERKIDDYELVDSINLVTYFVLFDFNQFQKADIRQKKELLLDFLYDSLLELFKLKQWDTPVLQDALVKSRNDGIIFRMALLKKVRRPSDKTVFYTASFVWEWGICDGFITKHDAKTKAVLSKTHVFTTNPRQFERRWDFGYDERHDKLVLQTKKYKRLYSISIAEIQ